ncbi:DNA adenine methylase [Flectobacillus sp. DC10W]|uniref:DNA adenine methylase n=1 Tax=Flectobacillus longus TaxID=2984207 RepID=A0ABT6YLJ8_9BACT|nr:DNA adenine methylase [Flectobacillus longus]MDI9864455.1 DNA adenine methylase [Flectobacillus longus]
MKTPIAYYGGKQSMLKEILPRIPEHKVYVEPFFGGGAVFFSKPQSGFEVINDINNNLITFYKVLKYDFEALQHRIDETFHSREQHTVAKREYIQSLKNIESPLVTAWAVWVQTNLSFGSKINSGFGYDRFGSCALRIFNKKNDFTSEYQERMRKVTIECYDALKVIKAYDSEDAFFYIDPPYVSSDQGHYKGYDSDDFVRLLDLCGSLKGKFLLSSYPETILDEYIQNYNWKHERIVKNLSVDGKKNKGKKKTECLTWNY